MLNKYKGEVKMKKKSKNLLLLIVLLAIIGIAVGYAALSQTLTLNGTATLKSDEWNVHFVESSASVQKNSTTYGDAEISLDSDLLKGTFTATLAPGEEVVYKVQVVNDGSIKAVATTPVISGETDNIKCSVSAAPTTQIADGGIHDYTVTLTCNDMESLPKADEVANVVVTFNYNQAQ